MFEVNDMVFYGRDGVCKIIGKCEKILNNNVIEYYELQPVKEKSATIFVPSHQEKLVAKMKPLLSKNDIYELIDKMADVETIWIEDKDERTKVYKDILVNGTQEQLIQLIKTLYIQEQTLLKLGKKLHMTDKGVFRDAEDKLHNEFAYILDIKKEEIVAFITSKINKDV